MTTFPELLRFKAGLMDGAYRMPGMLQALQQPPAQPVQAPQPPPQTQRGGIGGALGTIFGGANDPRLTDEQNQQARNQALMQAGLAILASPESGLQAIAQGGLFGQQAGAQNREAIYGRTQQERIANALQNPKIMGRLSPEQKALVQILPVEDATKLLASVLFAPPGEAKVVGDALVSPDGRVIYKGTPKYDDYTFAFQKLGVDPATATPADFDAAEKILVNLRRASASNVNVGGQQGAFERGLGEFQAKQFSGTQDAASQAISTQQTLDAMKAQIDAGMTTGWDQNFTLGARQALASFGFGNTENLGRQEAFNALGNQSALALRQNMPGALSDNDIKFLQQQALSLGKTPEGNRALYEILSKLNARKIAVAQLQERYVNERGNLNGWGGYLADWAENNPIFYKKAPF